MTSSRMRVCANRTHHTFEGQNGDKAQYGENIDYESVFKEFLRFHCSST